MRKIPIICLDRAEPTAVEKVSGMFQIYSLTGQEPELVNIGGQLYFKYVVGANHG